MKWRNTKGEVKDIYEGEPKRGRKDASKGGVKDI